MTMPGTVCQEPTKRRLERVDAFTVSVLRADEEVAWLTLAGELDLAAVGALSKAIGEAQALTPATVVLDLSQLSFLDSSGLGCIVEARMWAQQTGCRLALVPGPTAVQRTFEITGLDKHLEFVSGPVLQEWLQVAPPSA